MELGNIVFGNSRGEYRVERHIGWESQLLRLLDAYAPDRENSWREYGVEYENDTFVVMPYQEGDCECDYDKKEAAWFESHVHADNCYIHEFFKINIRVSKKEHEQWLDRKLKPLYKKYGWETDSESWWHGCAVRCSCEYNKQLDEFFSENSHTKDCPIGKPNFLHKPSGFSIQWYKYPFRDSYMNQPISLEQFREIITDCIASLRVNNEQ